MTQDRRIGMRRMQEHYPLALGLIASALFHLLFVILNPEMVAPSYGRAGGTLAGPDTPAAQFTVLSLSPRDEDEVIRMEAMPLPAASPPPRFGTPGAAPVETGGPGRGADAVPGADASVAERLRYNLRPFSAPVAPERETDNQRALRETRERVLRAGEELGPLPPNRVAGSGAGGGGGISIPFGFKPPPPAQTVPAPPLPDWILRRDSIRAAALAAARRDSLRAARDTTRLRNVAPRRPIIIRRVVPDTSELSPRPT
jgi:hypothetical protein